MNRHAKIPADMGRPRPLGWPEETPLYFTDNDAVLCRKHMGSAAARTGLDISGQPVRWVAPENRQEWRDAGLGDIQCETCKAQFARQTEEAQRLAQMLAEAGHAPE